MKLSFWQFAKSPRRLPETVVISGRNASLVRLALDEAISRLPAEPQDITRYYADETPPKTVLVELGRQPLFDANGDPIYQAIIYNNVERTDQDLQLLMRFVESPTPGTYLILVANDSPSEGTWLPQDDRITFVNCATADESQIAKYCQAQGLSLEDSEWLVEQCAGDVDEVVRNLDALSVFPEPWPEGLVRQTCSRLTSDRTTFPQYAVLDSGSDLALCTQLRRRLEQMILIAIHMPNHIPTFEMMQRANVPEGFIYKKISYRAKEDPPLIWLARLDKVIQAEAMVRQGMIGVREWLSVYL